MGQTDASYQTEFWDASGMKWTWWLICPGCGEYLCPAQWAQDMYADDIIGCDNCQQDISVDSAQWVLVDEDGKQ